MRDADPARLREAFNATRDRHRIVAIVSPTCRECLFGYGVIRAAFEAASSDGLRGFVVWIPMLAGDTRAAATSQAEALRHRRVIHAWDTERRIGRAFASTLGLSGPAWDVYLLYPAGIAWDRPEPPAPTFWMHQLGSDPAADRARVLNPAAFIERVRRSLAS